MTAVEGNASVYQVNTVSRRTGEARVEILRAHGGLILITRGQYIRGSLSWVASGLILFPGASSETYAPVWTWHIVG